MSFYLTDHKTLQDYHKARSGETKIGASISTFTKNWKEELAELTGKYVIMGVEEDIGPQANFGREGASEAWSAFLSAFMNMQNNELINIDNCALLGSFNFDHDLKPTSDLDVLREQVEYIDKKVEEVCQPIIAAGKTPIVIGGGHNNAYPLMRSAKQQTNNKLGVINLDPHADFRSTQEGRHSGNSFSQAIQEEVLSYYAVLGLHKAFNSQQILNDLNKYNCYYRFFDDELTKKTTWSQNFDQAVKYLKNSDRVGVELDLDCIKNMPVSAQSPTGYSVEEARKYLFQCQKELTNEIAYFHFPEGAPKLQKDGFRTVGRVLATFVYDLISKDHE